MVDIVNILLFSDRPSNKKNDDDPSVSVCRFDRHSNSQKPGARTTDFIVNSYREYAYYFMHIHYISRFVYCFGDRDDDGVGGSRK